MASKPAFVRNHAGTMIARPRVVVRPKRIEDLQIIVSDAKKFPSPIRVIGANYSQTGCAAADNGTLVDLRALNKVLEISDEWVRVQPGASLADVAARLEERGLQLPVNIELGNLSMGSAAFASTKDSSMPGESGQLASYLLAARIVTPQGKSIVVNGKDPELLRVVRMSYGLLGIATELVFKVVPLQPVRLDYETFSLDEFLAEYPQLTRRHCALKFYPLPFRNRVAVETRSQDDQMPTSRSGIWRMRTSVLTNVLPAFGATMANSVRMPGLKYFLIERFNNVMRATMDRAARGVVVYPTEWIQQLPKDSVHMRQSYTTWAFPETEYPRVLRDYFSFCREYYREHQYRANLMHVSHRLAQDKSAILSPSFAGPMVTLDPWSTRDLGWDDFLIEFNEFCSARGGVPFFNQTRKLTPEQVHRSFGDRLSIFARLRQRQDPHDRMLNRYFAQFLA
ncbi:MAG TPA: FAD-binding protein [Steroidobacteraceae bacterium]|nr:FAD-binding protein [Steroidobacteraceae bacterium]